MRKFLACSFLFLFAGPAFAGRLEPVTTAQLPSNLGTPSVLNLLNATGLPLGTGVTGTLPSANLPAFTGPCSTAVGSSVVSCAGLLAAANSWSGAQTYMNGTTTLGSIGATAGSNGGPGASFSSLAVNSDALAPPYTIFGVPQRNAIFSQFNAIDPNNAETNLFININSLPGSNAAATGTYALNLMAVTTVFPGGKAALVGNIVCNMGSGFTAAQQAVTGCSGLEIDIYGAGTTSGSAYGTANLRDGILFNGSSGGTNTNAIEIAGGIPSAGQPPLWDVGIRFSQYAPNVSTFATASIVDGTYAPIGYLNNGVQGVVFDLVGSYTRAFYSPGHLIDGAGNEISKTLTAGTATTTTGSPGAGDINDTLSGGTAFLDTGSHTNGFTQVGTYSGVGVYMAGSYTGTNALQLGNNLFRVSAGGTVQAQAYQVGTGASPTVGVSCSGTPSTSYVATYGIVTHC